MLILTLYITLIVSPSQWKKDSPILPPPASIHPTPNKIPTPPITITCEITQPFPTKTSHPPLKGNNPKSIVSVLSIGKPKVLPRQVKIIQIVQDIRTPTYLWILEFTMASEITIWCRMQVLQIFPCLTSKTPNTFQTQCLLLATIHTLCFLINFRMGHLWTTTRHLPKQC